ncbi:MAG: hypothetical protein JSR55_13145 [Proteobacteria bacterium]|nr:hypothetical protein [Pseudomonadota bacterium]
MSDYNKFKSLRERVWGPSESVEHPEGGLVWVRPPESTEIPLLHRLLIAEISPQAGTLETMMRVFAHNSDSFWLIERLPPDSETSNIVGFYAFLPLTAEGRAALEAHTLDTADPPLCVLAPFGDAPAAVYIWAIVARRLTRTLDRVIARAMGLRYADAPLYARVATMEGLKSGIGAGSIAVSGGTDIGMGSLIRLPPPNRGGSPS